MGSSALPLILLLMSLIHAGLTQERSKPVVKVTPDQRVFIGETVTLTCDIQGGGNIQWIYWFKAGYNYNPYRTTTTAEFSFRADYVYYSGKYSCRGERSDSQRSDISAAVTLTVSDLPTSTLTVTPDSPVFTGETVNLKCVIESYSDWRYDWYKGTNRVMLQTSDHYTVSRHTLTIRGVITSDQGQYWCKGQRDERPKSSQSSFAVHLSVKDLPTSTLTVTPDSPVFTGETVKLTCVIESYSNWRQRNGLTYDPRYDWTPDWRYEWYKGTDRVMLQTSDRYTVNRDTLTIRGATEFDQGHYWCRGQRDKRPSSSQSSSAVSFTVMGLPTSNMTVTPQTVFTEETVNLTCVIESYSNWRYEWYKGTNNSVMLQTSDHYTVNRDTLTIRGATESDQDQYWCRGQRDERPSSSQESKQMYLSVHVSASSSSSSSLPVIAVVVLLSVFLLIFISLLLLWRYKKNKDQQRNVNQTSDPNQSAEFQMENFPLQSADCDHIYDAVTEVNKRHKDDPETFSEITYSEVTVQKKIPVDKDDTTAESNEVTYSEVRTKVKKCKRKGADAGVCDAVYAQPTRKKGP
ncbi:opioid-binding protein/cell adhesion molecule homolog isoform X5 [Labeo rohita]|uniref:opioid-binding protein/cell adhesion molecule homolog isoform X5 n=1 Tax=Labeo rohita TaxID=84645 RepID=UPI0021E30309|nr:opioid-binding protein/cell adhesion molecule homolog isoform X5 [Labeo rohita]